MAALTEFELIDTLLKPLAEKAPGAFALSDDAALLPDLPPGEGYVVTKDALAIGTHMLASDPPRDMARKALRVNLSDLASMGARPIGFFMALCLGEDTDQVFLQDFVRGLTDDTALFDIPLMGGDIIKHQGAFTVSLTAFGAVNRGKALRRSGARIGDSLWVSGTIGDGALGLKAAQGGLPDFDNSSTDALIHRYRVPQPRVALGEALLGIASACIDVSDGLVADIEHICNASGVGCTIEADAVPLSDAAQAVLAERPDVVETILTGGDDYELAFAVPAGQESLVTELAQQTQTPITRIGLFEAEPGVRVVDAEAQPISFSQAGYRHD